MDNYEGEKGELFKVPFLPYYMREWKGSKIEIYCKVLNALSRELGNEFNTFLERQERIRKIIVERQNTK